MEPFRRDRTLATLRGAKATTVREETRFRGSRGRRVRGYDEANGEQPTSGAVLTGANALVCVDGSEGPLQALQHLLQWPIERVTLLYVSPSAAAGYVECGWMVLEAARHRCRLYARHPPLRCRLEVGDMASRIVAVCREEQPDVVALVAHFSKTPSVPDVSELAHAVAGVCAGRVILAAPRRIEIVAGEERLGRVSPDDDRGEVRFAARRSAPQLAASNR
jgi:hypothetical protein